MIKSRAMNASGRIPARARAIPIAILVASLLALVSSTQLPAHGRSLAPEPSSGFAPGTARMPAVTSSISALRMEAFAVSGQQQRNNGPDVLRMVLLTVGAAAAAAFLGLIGYVIRKRVGYWPHRPQPQEGVPTDEHH
jgi:hypothetical protein